MTKTCKPIKKRATKGLLDINFRRGIIGKIGMVYLYGLEPYMEEENTDSKNSFDNSNLEEAK